MRRFRGCAVLWVVVSLFVGVNLAFAAVRPLDGTIIVLDAGHGGIDFGVDPAGSGLLEKDVNLDITRTMRDQLLDEGAGVYLIRDSDQFVSLNARVRYANALLFRPDNSADHGRLLSIHLNSNRKNPDLRRVEMLVDPQSDGPFDFAADLAARMRAVTGGSIGYLDAGYPEGVHPADVAPVRWTYPRGHNVLSEAIYLSNPEQARLLRDRQFIRDVAAAHVAGLRQEFEAR
jgi:N-acetylmuramoyl-L-alanine amidase